MQENQKLNDALTHKTSSMETSSQVITQLSKEIEKLTSLRMDLEQKLAFMKSENSNLQSFKETFPYVLKESLKWVVNKNSKLKHSLKNLNEDDVEQVRECFKDAGIPLNFWIVNIYIIVYTDLWLVKYFIDVIYT